MAEAYPSSQIRHFRLNSSGTSPVSLFDEISQTNFQCGEFTGDGFDGFGGSTGFHILGSSGTIDTDQIGWKNYFYDLTLPLPNDAPGSSTDFMVDMHFAPGGFDRDYFHPFFQFELTASVGAVKTYLDFGYFVNTTPVGGGSTNYNVNVRWSCRRYDIYSVGTSSGLSYISTKLLNEYLHDTDGQFIHQVISSSDYSSNAYGGADLTNIDHVDFTTSNINNWRHKIYREGSAWKWYINDTLKASFSLSTSVIGARFGGVSAYANRSFTQQTYTDSHGYSSGSYEEFWVKSGTLSTDDKDVSSNESPFWIVKSGASSLATDTQESITGQNNISGIPASISSDANLPNVIAANTVGFPNPLYMADNYVADSYVGITFSAAMEQTFAARSVFDPLAGLARFGTSSISAASAINNDTGLIFDESMSGTSSATFASTAGRLLDTTYNFAADTTISSLGGNAIVGVISVTSSSAATGTATVEIIPDANISADTAINTVAGYLQTSGTLTLGADAQYVVDQTAGTTAGILFSGQASVATDMTAVLQGGLNFVVSTSLDIETATNIVGGYFKTFASSIAADAQTTIIPTLLKQTAQAQITSSHQTNFILNVNFTAKDTNINTSTQTSASGRILQAVDPFRAIDIASELRKIIVQAELRDDQINSESRINKINQETRKETMLSETRKAEIYNDKTIVQRSNRRVGDRI
jgi:hypothetical protein